MVSLDTAVKIAKAFNLPLEEVMEGVAPEGS
jgi:DNA-binding XRE family transcriptional regulator